MEFPPGMSREKRQAEILNAVKAGPVHLSAPQVRGSFRNGAHVREWAKTHEIAIASGVEGVTFTRIT